MFGLSWPSCSDVLLGAFLVGFGTAAGIGAATIAISVAVHLFDRLVEAARRIKPKKTIIRTRGETWGEKCKRSKSG